MPGIFRRVLATSASALRGVGTFALSAARAAYRPVFSSRRVYEDTLVGTIRRHLPGSMGTSDHYREKWKDIEGENNRGCKISEESFSSGYFKLKVPDHMMTNRALQKFIAVSVSDNDEVIEHRKSAIESAFDTGGAVKDSVLSKLADQQCKKLLALREHLRQNGGDITANSVPPGSNQIVLTVKIDVNGKSQKEVEGLVTEVFAAFGIRNPVLARSVSENLIKDAKTREMEGHTSSTDFRHPPEQQDERAVSSSEVGDRGSASGDQSVSSPSQPRQGDPDSAVEPGGLRAGDFSLAPPSARGGNPLMEERGEGSAAALQEEFLSRQGSVGVPEGGNSAPQDLSGCLRQSAMGLAGVTSGDSSRVGSASPTMLPPGIESHNRGRGLVEQKR